MKEWSGMPEFVQEKKEPFSKLVIRFETEKDLEDFAKLINQKLTPQTKSIWYPYKSHWGNGRKEWIDTCPHSNINDIGLDKCPLCEDKEANDGTTVSKEKLF